MARRAGSTFHRAKGAGSSSAEKYHSLLQQHRARTREQQMREALDLRAWGWSSRSLHRSQSNFAPRCFASSFSANGHLMYTRAAPGAAEDAAAAAPS